MGTDFARRAILRRADFVVYPAGDAGFSQYIPNGLARWVSLADMDNFDNIDFADNYPKPQNSDWRTKTLCLFV